jgi:6-phosphofructokinase 1
VRIAISTGGGDAPGLNAVIRAATLDAIGRGWEVLGIIRGYSGLLGEDEIIPLTRARVRGIGHLGGTILRTTNRGNPFRYPQRRADGTEYFEDRSREAVRLAGELGIDALIAIGGDGSLAIAQQLCDLGMHIVGVPKTIDNDVSGTITTFGFDTAVSTALDAIDKLHTTAESHDRVMVLEVMGRQAGFIALHSGLAGTADVILIPEIPYDIEVVCEKVMGRDRAGRRFSIVVCAEGAFPIGGEQTLLAGSGGDGEPRLGGIGEVVAQQIGERTGKECRSMVLGHLQRGGQPTGYDRLLATRFGGAAVRAVAGGRWGQMVALQSPHIVTVPIAEAIAVQKRVDPSHDTVQTAREIGISFGDRS